MQFVMRGQLKVFVQTDEEWHYIVVPPTLRAKLSHAPKSPRGFIKASIKLGECTWDTAFIPMDRGNYFLPIPMDVLDIEDIYEDDEVTVSVLIH